MAQTSTLAAALLVAMNLLGCSSQQRYGAAQAWQFQECSKIPDAQERSRCMANANMSYEEYKRQAEAARTSK